ncbi:MAG: hypothetical protein H7A24_05365 [Leptospiraceae bacterium]|nr:hypothetical protein [Leptospiraceae bacterium]MCP5511287.1 hypothetical protein [Leptospiraceae bacterium]
MQENIDNLLKKIDSLMLVIGRSKYTQEMLDYYEKKLNKILPSDYKKTLLHGDIDKGTFHFIEPYLSDSSDDHIAFASWNNDVFLFDTTDPASDYPVLVHVPGTSSPEKKYANFLEWFTVVVNSISSVNNPD